MSRATRRLPFRPSGTSPSAMRPASPSTMAVLPTPGSPMRTGLFFVRRESTWMTRRISSSRPMTGSILPSRARCVRSWPYFSSAWNWSSGFGEVTRWLPRTSRSACSTSSRPDPQAVAHGQQQVLDGEVVVLEVLAGGLGPVEHVAGLTAQPRLAAPVGVGELGHRLIGPVAQHQGRQAQLLHHGGHDGVVLAHERAEQVVRRQLRVARAPGRLHRRGHGLLGLGRPLGGVEGHASRLSLGVDPATARIKFPMRVGGGSVAGVDHAVDGEGAVLPLDRDVVQRDQAPVDQVEDLGFVRTVLFDR